MVVGTNFTHQEIYMNYHHLTIEERFVYGNFTKMVNLLEKLPFWWVETSVQLVGRLTEINLL